MKNTLSENLKLLNQDAQKIFGIRFSILFSINRTSVLPFLKNYSDFYNAYRKKVLEENPGIVENRIPELVFKEYSLSERILFWTYILQWNYIVKMKKDLAIGLQTINSVVEKPVSKNSNYTAPKAKRR